MSTTNNNGVSAPHKTSRVLACVLCQHRKIKCDRNMPCSNCVKANVTCTPSTPAPARKRRRPNQDLQERLARCEQLLKQYVDGATPASAPAQSISPATHDSPSESVFSGTKTPEQPKNKWKAAGKMVKEEGGAVRFMDSVLWASIQDELQAMRKIVDTDEPDESSIFGSEDMSPNCYIDLLLPTEPTRNIEDLHPDPVHLFRLWQLFLDRVNPLMKIIHVPTLQPYVMEAATSMNNLPLNYQALLFAVFNMAVVSMSDIECTQILGTSREDALKKFTMGTKVALTRFNFLKNYDMAALQALVLFLFSLHNRYDRHAAWVLSGVVVRIAQKMGYHRDGELLNLTQFETEMRRRIWWQILLQDAKNALVSGLSNSMLPSNWDTKPASNLNDADLFPGATEAVTPREGPTEMAFCLLVYQIAKFMIAADGIHGTHAFEAAIMGHDVDDGHEVPAVERYRLLVDELDDNLRAVETRYIDTTASAIHAAALTVRPMLTSKLREMLVPMKQQPEWGTEIFNIRDNLFKVVIMNNEDSTNAYDLMDEKGFLWFAKLHFQLDVFAIMTGQLYHRPSGSLSDRAWKIIDKIYTFHSELFDMSQKQYHTQAQFVLLAWRARERAFGGMGQAIELPHSICRLRECVSSNESRASDTPSQTPTAQQMAVPLQITELDQFLGGYLDVSALNWDMWGDMPGVANGNISTEPIPQTHFNGYHMGS